MNYIVISESLEILLKTNNLSEAKLFQRKNKAFQILYQQQDGFPWHDATNLNTLQ